MFYELLFFCPPQLGGTHTSKSKRAKNSTHKQKVVVVLYEKVCDVVGSISELLEIQLLTDTTILQVPSSELIFESMMFIVQMSHNSPLFVGVHFGYNAFFCGERLRVAVVCDHPGDSRKSSGLFQY